MTDVHEPRAGFTRMEDSTAADWELITMHHAQLVAGLPGRIMDHLRLLDGDFGGFPVDRLTHSLQTAALAEADGRDTEYVVCALLHDVGDTLGPLDHPGVAAAILEPVVSAANHWMVRHHGIFQGYYFWHHLGLDRNARDDLRDHEHYGRTEEFCRLYDMPAFDPDRTTPPLEYFTEAVAEVFAPPSLG